MTTKEMRKHIKPYLRFAISELKKSPSRRKNGNCLCSLATAYVNNNNLPYKLEEYICKRLDFARPKDSGITPFWWGATVSWLSRKGSNLRIDFCRLQLKIVNP